MKTLFIAIIVSLVIGSLFFYGGYKLFHFSNVTREKNCYHCPNPKCNFLFNKDSCNDCNITRINEQELGSDWLCKDMGATEMGLKFGFGLMCIGIFLPIMIVMTIILNYHKEEQ